MAWFSVRLFKQATPHRQALRRHAQRRHAHFYQLRSDWTVFRSWPFAEIDWRRKPWVVAAASALLALFGMAVLPSFASIFRVDTYDDLPAIALTLPEQPIATFVPGQGDDRVALIDGVYAPLSEASLWTSVTIERGQTLGEIFGKFGISPQQLARLVAAAPSADSFTRLRPGDRIGIRRDSAGTLTALQLNVDSDTRRIVEISGDQVSERTIERPVEKRMRVASGRIVGSLFGAGEEAGLDDGTIIKLAKVFGYDIDFAQDLRRGDQFAVVFEEMYRDGEVIAGGEIIAATFVNRGRRFDALRFEKSDGSVEYYDQGGRPLRKAFIRTPVEFSRISSRFSSARRHPILGTVRAHKGVDYAAPSGTPIIAAAAGRVRFAGWRNGYGRVVEIDHGRGHSTLYAHMSRFGKSAKSGTRVQQGDNIGYVGMTGLATAPHLHYEFRINGMHRDPLKVTLPPPQPLPGAAMARFRASTAPFIRQLARAELQTAASAPR
ncbi:MAG: peptidoglycan DD-metalloendopeptidase family protein [Xanthomonadales bacterium]|nr:peptidoglycan DD-metalloendopeptidase family protein [Xanthomonadales bacterium]